MPVDPDLAKLLPLIAAAPKFSEGSPDEARAGFKTLMVDLRDPATLRPVDGIEDTEVAGVPVRVYRPAGDGPRPTVVFFHGGGFVIGSVVTHDGPCRDLADIAQAVVVSVDYRLAPEHPFPAAVEDCWVVLQAVGADIDSYGGDAARLAVAGDSAGGNLSAVCAQLARDHDGPPLAAQLLIYPSTDPITEYPSMVENAEGYLLTRDDIEWFGHQYVGMQADDPRAAELIDDARLAPLRAPSLEGLPPAVVVTCEYDPLRDEGDAYATALEKAGVPVRHRRFDGLTHGFLGLEQISPAIADASRWCDEQLRDTLGPGSA